MNEQFMFQLGSTLTVLQSQIQQLQQALQLQTQQHQETRELMESLAKAQGWEYSQDRKAWVSTK